MTEAEIVLPPTLKYLNEGFPINPSTLVPTNLTPTQPKDRDRKRDHPAAGFNPKPYSLTPKPRAQVLTTQWPHFRSP